ncbi:MAG: pyridoxamine 5'-phosphate oxidase family protein [Bacteroidota bacterium]
MEKSEISTLNKVVRGAKRALYEREIAYDIIDSHMICHVAYVYEGYAISIPTGYGRSGDMLYLHGSLKNRMLLGILEADKVSVTITHLDGLVLARSVFHHSVNYRSAMVFGKPRVVEDPDEKMKALEVITENFIQGRWQEARTPNDKEFRSTLVIGVSIDQFSAKVRAEGVNDELSDMELDIWAGVVPIHGMYGQPIPEKDLNSAIEAPDSVRNLRKQAPL